MISDLNTEFSDEAHSPGLALWRVTNAWQRAIRTALEPFGLTHVQFVLLAVLTAMDRSEPVTQRDLADHAATDVMMTSQVLRALEGKGFVERLAHPTDGRARTLAPTPAGIALVNRANAVVEAADRAYFAPLGNSVANFTRNLGTLDDVHRSHQADS
ncbi:MAG: MarR family transcriptional regulator [Frankiaceae bacterium]|jgi:DNA-binding MarR family transcriptional regulator|nr:MarR family transcriptional regulator [Frankiaceae bacterium]